ncbi:MAG: phage major capsid protein, P2 family [Pseudomonas sp.]|uniref:phage major capsid protein, P2 family n=1 Tax=Pseudomonas sp. TaxID=306 RepID=UPI0033993583
MRNDTRALYNAYCQALATLNGVDSVGNKFNVTPTVQQTLETRIQESSEFLTRISMIGRTEQEGDKLGLGIGGTIAGTTDTNAAPRQTQDLHSFDEIGYRCTQTNFDTHIRYAILDAWAKFPDFQTRLRDAIIKRQALDRILIGFNGTSRAATSNRGTSPMLQDVNIGWLQKYRNHAPARVMKEVVAASGKVTHGVGGDYENLDALVYDAVNNMIDPWHQEDTELVVICGRGLLHDKYFPIVNKTQAPTETLAADIILSHKQLGGLPAMRVPGFPQNALMVTRLDNLALYWQEGARRRNVIENSARDRIENYESSNEAYVIEDFGCGCVVENIQAKV